MKKFLVLKAEGKFEKGKVYDKDTLKIKENYYKSLLKRDIITEDLNDITKALAENDAQTQKYSFLMNKKFVYQQKIDAMDEPIKVSVNEILRILLSKRQEKFELKPENETIVYEKSDLENNVFKEIKVKTKEDFEIVFYVKLAELPLKKQIKTLGIKSIFIDDNKLLFTSELEPNSVIVEKTVENNDINTMKSKQPENYSITNIDNRVITLVKGKKAYLASNPGHSSGSEEVIIKKVYHASNPGHSSGSEEVIIKKDYLGRKEEIEMTFFGKTFKDNIHIQLAYNILDINKIFSLYINEIVYTFENLARDMDAYDFIGNIGYKQDKWDADEKFKEKMEKYYINIESYLKYFSNAFSSDFYDKNTSKEAKIDELYKVLQALSLIRQFSTHGYNDIYNLSNLINHNIVNRVDKIFKDSYDLLAKSFVENTKNLQVLMTQLKIDNSEAAIKELLNDYFDFSVRKTYKNMGFNFVKLKEKLLEEMGLNVEDENKKAVYSVVMYIIYTKLRNEKQLVDSYVQELRYSSTNEEKDAIYKNFAKELCKNQMFDNIITEELIKTDKTEVSEISIDESWLIKNINIDIFCKICFFMTSFLDKKEINMFITSIINKLNNIGGFIDILGDDELLKEYSFFKGNNARKIASDLSVVLNLARMQKNYKKSTNEKDKATNDMKYDAYCLFGYQGKRNTFYDDTKCDRESKNGEGKIQNKIHSTIINSNMFRYVVKYANPKECYKMMKNKNIVAFVLKKLPQAQLSKYLVNRSMQELIEDLCFISIDSIRNSFDDKMDLAKLYLTIVYQIVKNLVRINSYYNIAFSCMERDKKLFNLPTKYHESSDLILLEAFRGLNNEFNIAVPTRKHKVNGIIKEVEKLNINKYSWLDDDIKQFKDVFYKNGTTESISNCNIIYRKAYRNGIAHLNFISRIGQLGSFSDRKEPMKSYFELYQYLIQINFVNSYERESEIIEKYKEELDKYKTYSKDLLHLLNLPFAYNMARYKNLTIEDIFYDRYKVKIKELTIE